VHSIGTQTARSAKAVPRSAERTRPLGAAGARMRTMRVREYECRRTSAVASGKTHPSKRRASVQKGGRWSFRVPFPSAFGGGEGVWPGGKTLGWRKRFPRVLGRPPRREARQWNRMRTVRRQTRPGAGLTPRAGNASVPSCLLHRSVMAGGRGQRGIQGCDFRPARRVCQALSVNFRMLHQITQPIQPETPEGASLTPTATLSRPSSVFAPLMGVVDTRLAVVGLGGAIALR
jgi:hypothetical protein